MKATLTFSVQIFDGIQQLTSLPGGLIGVPYGPITVITDFPAPVTWGLTGLPGVAITPIGPQSATIAGTPTATGIYPSVTVSVNAPTVP